MFAPKEAPSQIVNGSFEDGDDLEFDWNPDDDLVPPVGWIVFDTGNMGPYVVGRSVTSWTRGTPEEVRASHGEHFFAMGYAWDKPASVHLYQEFTAKGRAVLSFDYLALGTADTDNSQHVVLELLSIYTQSEIISEHGGHSGNNWRHVSVKIPEDLNLNVVLPSDKQDFALKCTASTGGFGESWLLLDNIKFIER